jgi:hypothetical protein
MGCRPGTGCLPRDATARSSEPNAITLPLQERYGVSPVAEAYAMSAPTARTCTPTRAARALDAHPISACEEYLNKLEVFRDRNHPQRVAVEQCPPGAVLVIDSRKDARAASAGSILISRLMGRRLNSFRPRPRGARAVPRGS